LTRKERVLGGVVEELRRDHGFRDPVRDDVGGAGSQRGLLATVSFVGLGGFMGEDPPGVGFSPECVFVGAGSYPRWITDLQVEAAQGEDRREVQLPVEEALIG